MVRDGLADVGEAVTPADRAGRDVRTVAQDRHAFARMIATFPARIAAVICGQQQEIA